MPPKKKKAKAKKEKPKPAFWTEDFPGLVIEEDKVILPRLEKRAAVLQNTMQNLWSLGGKRTNHYASEAFNCPRQVLLRRAGVYPTDESTAEEAMETGKFLEKRAVEFYEVNGVLVPYSGQIRTAIRVPELEYPIMGKVDLLVYEDGAMIPIEVKKAKDFDEILSGWEGWKSYKPRQGDAAQLTSYQHFLKDFYAPYTGELVRPPTYGYVQYEMPNRNLRARWKVPYHEGFFNAIVAYFATIEELEKTGEIPTLSQASEILMKFGAKGKPLDGESFPCIWFPKGKAKGDKEELTGTAEAGRCQFYSGCWGDKKFTSPENSEKDLPIVLKALAERAAKKESR